MMEGSSGILKWIKTLTLSERMIHYTSLTSVASKRIFLDISFIIASSMNKFRDKLRGQTINERNPESIVYIETKQRRKPTQQVLFTEKTE